MSERPKFKHDWTEVTRMPDADEMVGVYVNGHLTDADFEQAKADAVAYMKHHYDDDVSVVSVSREQWRSVPRPYGSQFIIGSGRGSYPVTIVSFEEWAR